ncbi:MAG: KEOPS complex subunit Pcc1 [Methanoregula sp.]
MSLHEALFRFSTSHAEQICSALIPELADEVNPRSTTRVWLEGEDILFLKVEAQDIAALRAALNMVLRLVNVADEMQDLAGSKT